MMKKNCAVILASGTGSRMGLDIPKQFYKIGRKTILELSIETFENHAKITSIIVVSNPDFIDLAKKLALKYSKVKAVISGGETRQKSSFNGVNAVSDEKIDNILIHDAVRPFVSTDIIDRCLSALEKYQAVNVAISSSDTIIQVDENNIIKSVPNRKFLRRCQTPQCFKYSLIKKAHELADKENYFSATDDCSLILRYNLAPVYIVEGNEQNIKITYLSDIKLAKEIIRNKI